MSTWKISSASNQVLVEFAEIGILSLRHFDLQEVSTGVPTQARLKGVSGFIDIAFQGTSSTIEWMIFLPPSCLPQWWVPCDHQSVGGFTAGVEWTQGTVAWTWFGWHLSAGGACQKDDEISLKYKRLTKSTSHVRKNTKKYENLWVLNILEVMSTPHGLTPHLLGTECPCGCPAAGFSRGGSRLCWLFWTFLDGDFGPSRNTAEYIEYIHVYVCRMDVLQALV